MTTEFGQYLGERLDELGLKPGRAGSYIGVLQDGRSFDASNVGKMLRGERRSYDSLLVARLIQLFGLDVEKACRLADVNEKAVRELLDNRERLTVTSIIEAVDRQIADGPTFAARRAARRGRRGTPPGTAATAITAAATLAAGWLTHRAGGTHTTDLTLAAATLSGERAAPQVTAIPWWAPAEERRAA